MKRKNFIIIQMKARMIKKHERFKKIFKTLLKQRFKQWLEQWFLLFWLITILFVQINVKDFPFDRQTCRLKYSSWAYDATELHIKKDNSSFITDHYVEGTEWRLSNIEFTENSILYKLHVNPWQDLTILFTMERLVPYPFLYAQNMLTCGKISQYRSPWRG